MIITNIFQNMTALNGKDYLEYLRELKSREGDDYDSYLQKIIHELGLVTKMEQAPITTENTECDTRWRQFAENYATEMTGCHILSHGSELGDARIIEVLDKTTKDLKTMIANSLTTESSLLEYISTRAVKGDLQKPSWKKTPEGYSQPINLRMIIKVPGLRQPKRAVQVNCQDAELIKRHDGNSYNFQVKQGAEILSMEYLDTILVTYWIYFPSDTSRQSYWTFGTSYVTDTYPFEKEYPLNVLLKIKNGKPQDPAYLKKLIEQHHQGDVMYALTPPGN